MVGTWKEAAVLQTGGDIPTSTWGRESVRSVTTCAARYLTTHTMRNLAVWSGLSLQMQPTQFPTIIMTQGHAAGSLKNRAVECDRSGTYSRDTLCAMNDSSARNLRVSFIDWPPVLCEQVVDSVCGWNYNYPGCFTWVWNLVAHTEEDT
jgi:hypothetical protein